jgi:uncharacterized protein (DUF302 family)
MSTINLPSTKSEFELQSELFSELKRIGFTVFGEVPAMLDGRKSHFDLVVFDGKKAAVIIEVKNSPCRAVVYGKKTKQVKKYQAYGLPVIFHTTLHSIEETVNKVQKLVAPL